MRKTWFILLCLQSLLLMGQSTEVWEAPRQGIIGDGATLNTEKIQTAIDRISRQGGGRLSFPPGIYLTGSIVMKDGVELHLERGATLRGSENPYHYFKLEQKETELRNDNSQLALLLADHVKQIALTGEGTIDGNGRALALNIDSLHHTGERTDPHYNYKRMRPNETMRPKLFYFTSCSRIEVKGLTLMNSAAWGLSFDRCTHLTLEGLRVVNRAYWNNDGIDLTDCKQVKVSHCDIDSADDGICLKSYHADSCNDSITISDCTICSSASGIKFGTASQGGFKHIDIRRIRVRDTFRSAVAIESVDGGVIEDIYVSDIIATRTGNALFIRLGHRSGNRPGSIRRVRISRLWCEVPFDRPDIGSDMRGPEVNFFHNPFPSSVTGIPGASVEDVCLEDIEIVCPGRSSKGMAYIPLSRLHQVPEQEKEYPEFTMFGELPSWGFYVRHVRGLQLKRVRLFTREEEFRPAIVLDDVHDVTLEDVESNFQKPWIVTCEE